jgi:hypothetical protein
MLMLLSKTSYGDQCSEDQSKDESPDCQALSLLYAQEVRQRKIDFDVEFDSGSEETQEAPEELFKDNKITQVGMLSAGNTLDLLICRGPSGMSARRSATQPGTQSDITSLNRTGRVSARQ